MLILGVIVAAQFMVVLDVAIVNVALPTIKTDLRFSQAGLQWVVTAYGIFFGGTLLLGGRLADLFGRRRMFLLGLTLFTASSLLDGLAWSGSSLIGFRSLQGFGAALLSPAALSILTTTFKEGRDRSRALAVWGAAGGTAGTAGVLVGGVLTSAFTWSWIFFINVPLGIVALVLGRALLPESQTHGLPRRFDLPGAASVTTALMLLVYAMTRAVQDGWTTGLTLTLLACSAALIVVFVIIELRTKSPLLPMRMFRRRMVAGSNIAGLLGAAALFSQIFLMTLYLQQVLGYSPLRTGVAYIALTLTIVVCANAAQRLVLQVGVRRVLPLGLLLSTSALLLYTRLPVHGQYFRDVFPALLVAGFGGALSFVPVAIGALTGARAHEAGVASGLVNTSQQMGGAIGVAVANTIATTFAGHYLRSHPNSEAAALTHGFSIAFYVLAGVTFAGMVLSAVVVDSAMPGEEQVEAQATARLDEAA